MNQPATEQGKYSITGQPAATVHTATQAANEQPAPPHAAGLSFFDRLFSGVARKPLAALICLLILFCLHSLCTPLFTTNSRDLWAPAETRQAAVAMESFNTEGWLLPTFDTADYLAEAPGWYWLLELLHKSPLPFSADISTLLQVLTALSVLLLLLSAWALACAATQDKRAAFGAVLMLASTFFFSGISHYAQSDILFAALLTFACAGICAGMQRPTANALTLLGFLCAGLACLIKGPHGIIIPLLAIILWLASRFRFGRLNKLDSIAGLVLMLLPGAAWLVTLLILDRQDAIEAAFIGNLAPNILHAPHGAQPVWYYLAVLPLIWLPWTLLIFFVPFLFARTKKQQAPVAPAAAPAPAANGTTPPKRDRLADSGPVFLLFCIAVTFVGLSFVSLKNPAYLLPLLPALAVFCAHALFRLENGGKLPCFGRAYAALLLVLGVVCCMAAAWRIMSLHGLCLEAHAPWLAKIPTGLLAVIEQANGCGVLGLLLLAAGLLLLALPRRSAGGILIFSSILGVAVSLMGTGIIAPSLDTVMSPRNQAEFLGRLADRGYSVATLESTPGMYDWYARRNISEAASTADLKAIAYGHEDNGAAFILPAAQWQTWSDRPIALRLVQSQWIAGKEYAVAVQPPQSPAGEIAEQPLWTGPPSERPVWANTLPDDENGARHGLNGITEQDFSNIPEWTDTLPLPDEFPNEFPDEFPNEFSGEPSDEFDTPAGDDTPDWPDLVEE